MESTAKPNSQSPVIIVLGIICIIGVSVLTFFATRAVVNKINQNADYDYLNIRDWFLAQQAALLNRNVSDEDEEVQVTNYTSDDLVEIEGEWYLISSLAVEGSDTASNVTTLPPITVDKNDIVMVNGNEYMHILNPEILADASSNSEFYGNEYIVVDIDGTMVYLVSKGDTLSKVSGRIGYSVQDLAKFNQINNVNLIYEGQTLRVPASDEILEYVKSHQEDFPTVEEKRKEMYGQNDESVSVKNEESITEAPSDDNTVQDVQEANSETESISALSEDNALDVSSPDGTVSLNRPSIGIQN